MENRKELEWFEEDEEEIDPVEQFFQDALAKSLTFDGMKYDKMILNLHGKSDTDEIEFDIALVNGNSIAIIEVKNRAKKSFVQSLAGGRVKTFRNLFPEFKNHKAYLGIAAFSFSKEVREQAKKYGVALIKQSGDSIEMKPGKLKVY